MEKVGRNHFFPILFLNIWAFFGPNEVLEMHLAPFLDQLSVLEQKNIALNVHQVAAELQAVSILSSKNLSGTLRFLSSSIEVLLLEDFIDVEDVEDSKDDAVGSEREKNVENQNEATKNVKEWEDERYKEDDDEEDEEGPLFALYCGGETSVIAGLGQENGYYQVRRFDLI